MTNEDRIEAVRRAAVTSVYGWGKPLTDEMWERFKAHDDDRTRRFLFTITDAVYAATLQSLREPSEAMVVAADNIPLRPTDDANVPAETIWAAMIDRAIEDMDCGDFPGR